ncbi:MAG: protein phosphatase 2C domain-containing protein [Myxococcota bacterium]
MHFWAACVSDAAGRAQNEDAFRLDADLGLFVVADGMGGHEGGALASKLAVDSIHTAFRSQRTDADLTRRAVTAIRIGEAALRRKQRGALRNMGTTVVLLAVAGDEGVVAHIGDSRAYRQRRGSLTQLTRDHSYTELMRAAGMAPKPSLRHLLVRSLGHDGKDAEVSRLTLSPGDSFLLCTDGLSDVVPSSLMERVLRASYSPQEASERLVSRACRLGTRDNCTAMVVRVD